MRLKRVAAIAGLTALALAAGAFLFAWSGLYNVAATAGHWPPTAWLLHFTMESSVRTHAALLEAPPLADPLLVERGAGHYETGCMPCHGAPGAARNRIPDEMLPPPPFLWSTVPEWSPEELFWIIRHGLKYTGMPAWPAQNRDDEVWALTAFVLQLPGMEEAEYERLALGSGRPRDGGEPPLPDTPGALFTMGDAALIGACARCHGIDGSGRPSGAFPRLDIQTPDYLARALREYAGRIRPSGIMQPVAAAIEPEDVARLAAHFSASGAPAANPSPIGPAAGPQSLSRGEAIATAGLPAEGVPACASCHGLAEGPDNPDYPALAGQSADFLRGELRRFAAGTRGGSGFSDVMTAAVRKLDGADIDAVAAYYYVLRPARPNAAAR